MIIVLNIWYILFLTITLCIDFILLMVLWDETAEGGIRRIEVPLRIHHHYFFLTGTYIFVSDYDSFPYLWPILLDMTYISNAFTGTCVLEWYCLSCILRVQALWSFHMLFPFILVLFIVQNNHKCMFIQTELFKACWQIWVHNLFVEMVQFNKQS